MKSRRSQKQVTEAQLLKLGDCGRLQDIKELDLTDNTVESLDAKIFNKLTSLRSLYLSGTNLRNIPDDLRLNQLEALDVVDNDLHSVEAFKNFPNLRELHIDGNTGISEEHSYIVVFLCPQLECLDGQEDLEGYRSAVRSYESQLSGPLRAVWEAKFDEVYGGGVPEQEIDNLHTEFISTVKSAGIVGSNLSMLKLRSIMIDRLARQLIGDINTDVSKKGVKRARCTPAAYSGTPTKYSTRTSSGTKRTMDYSSGTPLEKMATPARKRRRSQLSPDSPAATYSVTKKRRENTPSTPVPSGSSEKKGIRHASKPTTPASVPGGSSEKKGIRHASKPTTPASVRCGSSEKKGIRHASKPTSPVSVRGGSSEKKGIRHASKPTSPVSVRGGSSEKKGIRHASKPTSPVSVRDGSSEKKGIRHASKPTTPASVRGGSSEKNGIKQTSKTTTPASGKRKAETESDFTELKERVDEEEQDGVADYDPTLFLRCHSDDNDPKDENTKIWKCAFEPKIGGKPGETGTMLATCGGKIVCFIDCQTGKVMRRYKDSSESESFYALAWTTLKTSGKHVNILAVAGQDGQIKLIHPSQLVMLGIVGSHRCYINSLLFNPRQPNILYSGSMDKKVIVWDVEITDLKACSLSAVKKTTLCLPKTDAVSLVYSTALDLLIAGCDNSCYAWQMGKVKGKNTSPHYEFVHPTEESGEDGCSEVIDGLVLLSNNCIVSKCVGHSCLYVWDLKRHLVKQSGSLKQVPVRPLALLEYTPFTVDYVYPSAMRNQLMVGDDRGRVHMYDLRQVVKKLKPSDEILVPSRILEYPDTSLADGTSQKMTDVTEAHDDVVVNCVAMSSDHSYLVYGTDTNLVCLWNKASN